MLQTTDMMWSTRCLVIASLCLWAAAEDVKVGGVVYLIDKLQSPVDGVEKVPENKIAKHVEGGVELGDPIPEGEALADGIYYKPADGKPLAPKTVSSESISSTLLVLFGQFIVVELNIFLAGTTNRY